MLGADGYRTKAELKASVGQQFHYIETSFFDNEFNPNGDNVVVGPHPQERRWYATVTCQDGRIVRVK